MNRRTLLKRSAALGGGLLGGIPLLDAQVARLSRPRGLALRLAHLTDIHLAPNNHAPERFARILDLVCDHDLDLVLNGGDTVMAVDYGDITRERVHGLWDLWHRSQGPLRHHAVHSCLGNHDMWWAAPDQTDPMYGKPYAVQQLGMPQAYYSFEERNWHFVVLDSNHSPAGSLGEEQMNWLKEDLASVDRQKHILVMSHYPIFAAICQWEGGMHTDYRELLTLFYQYPNLRACISGHMHLLERLTYNGVEYFCNGALSGFWWGEGDEHSAGKNYYKQTPPGFALLDLYDDGRVANRYLVHGM